PDAGAAPAVLTGDVMVQRRIVFADAPITVQTGAAYTGNVTIDLTKVPRTRPAITGTLRDARGTARPVEIVLAEGTDLKNIDFSQSLARSTAIGDEGSTIRGGRGSDTITAAVGNNTLTGGAARDRFIIRDGGGHVITDFDASEDKIAAGP